MTDDLGQGEINQQNNNYSFNIGGSFSRNIINTPNLEVFAKQSTSFHHVWASSVCSPSRYSLLTGYINTLADVRGNNYDKYDVSFNNSFTRELNNIGYKTGIVGKFGFGDVISPLDIGFDYYFGYDTHVDAHYPFPRRLRNNRGYTFFQNNNFATKNKCFLGKCTFSGDIFLEKSLNFIRNNKNESFFLLWTPVSSHAGYWQKNSRRMSYPVTSFGEYRNRTWSESQKMYAYSVSTIDRDIRLLTNLLRDLDIENNTLIVFTSDNGAEMQFSETKRSEKPTFFNGSGGRKGMKRSIYEGGINVPVMIKWLDNVPQNSKNYYPWAFHDFAASFLDIAGVDNVVLSKFTNNKGNNITNPVSMKNIWRGLSIETNRKWLSSEFCESEFCKYTLLDVRNWKNTLPKLIYDNGYEFYDIKNDTKELYNLKNNGNFEYMKQLMYRLRNLKNK